MNEKELFKQIVNRNEKSFDLLFTSYSSMVYNVALSYTKNSQDAEDITQDVFVTVYNKASSFKGDSSLKTWIYRITINTSLNFIKKRDKHLSFKRKYQIPSEHVFDHPGTLPSQKEKANILFMAMDCLNANQKTAFILRYIDNLSQKEVALIMKVSVKAIESLLQRAKKKLRIELERKYLEGRKFEK